ncbi:MAG TPA: hypothetical protein VF037_11670, partial [Gemmatimonadales bacterium]
MRFREVLRFELASQFRRVTIWVTFVALLAFACMITLAADPADGEVMRNSPFGIVFVSVLAGVVWLLIGGSVAGEAAARDMHSGMHPLVYTLPLRKGEYLGGRLVAACLVNALILLAIPAGVMIATALAGIGATPLASFDPAAYLSAFGVVTLPFAIVVTAVQFAWALSRRSAMASYAASVAIFVVSHAGLFAILRLAGREDLLTELDLVGIGGILFAIGERLTPAEQNTRLIALDPALLLNRALWLGIALAVSMLAWRRFRFAHPSAARRRRMIPWLRRRRGASSAHLAAGETRPIAVPDATRAFGAGTRARQALALALASFRTATGGRFGLALGGLFALHLIVLLPEYMRFMGVPLRPDTGHVLSMFTAPLTEARTPLVVIPLLIAYFAGEIHWRERDTGIDEMADALPLPDAVRFLGRLLGLGLAIAAWLTLLGSAAILGQLAMGHAELRLPLYFGVLFGLQLPEYLLFAVLALAIHAAADHKYLGHVLAIAALGAIGFAPALGVRHHLLVYSASPGWSWSDMRGFGPGLGPWIWFKVYWAGWALLLGVGATLVLARGREGRVTSRFGRARITAAARRVALAAVALIVAAGGVVFYN